MKIKLNENIFQKHISNEENLLFSNGYNYLFIDDRMAFLYFSGKRNANYWQKVLHELNFQAFAVFHKCTLYIWILEVHMAKQEQYQRFLCFYQVKLKISIVSFSELHNIIYRNLKQLFMFLKTKTNLSDWRSTKDNGLQKILFCFQISIWRNA